MPHKDQEKRNEYARKYKESHKEEIKVANNLHYEKNKNTIQAKRQIKNICACGGSYTNNHKAQHLASKKHQTYEEKNI